MYSLCQLCSDVKRMELNFVRREREGQSRKGGGLKAKGQKCFKNGEVIKCVNVSGGNEN